MGYVPKVVTMIGKCLSSRQLGALVPCWLNSAWLAARYCALSNLV